MENNYTIEEVKERFQQDPAQFIYNGIQKTPAGMPYELALYTDKITKTTISIKIPKLPKGAVK